MVMNYDTNYHVQNIQEQLECCQTQQLLLFSFLNFYIMYNNNTFDIALILQI